MAHCDDSDVTCPSERWHLAGHDCGDSGHPTLMQSRLVWQAKDGLHVRYDDWREVNVDALTADRDRSHYTRAQLIEAASVFLSVVTLELPHRFENSPAERRLRSLLSERDGTEREANSA